jgi:hypothetical protein
VFSNIELLTIPYEKVDSPRVLFELSEPCFLLLDELWHLADSRKSGSGSLINAVMCMLLLRSRKQKWVVGYSQQWYTQTDIRIRFITDVWIMPEFYRDRYLKEDIYDKHANPLCTRWYDGSKFFEDYDTEADPFTLNIDELKFEYDSWLARKSRGLAR